MTKRDEPLRPESLEEQLQQLAQPVSHSSEPTTLGADLVRDLHLVHADYTLSGERVWTHLAERLREQNAASSPFESLATHELRAGGFANPQTLERSERAGRRANRLERPRERQRSRWLEICAAVLIIVALLGGTIFALKKVPAAIPASRPSSAPLFTPGSYTLINSRLFSNTSPWNVPIGTNVQLNSNSRGMVGQLATGEHVPTLYRYGMPIYTSTASDPTYAVRDSGNDRLFASYQPIHIPDDAAPSPGSDHWMFVYDTTKKLIFEMWETKKVGDTWSTQTAAVYSPTGDGVLQADGSTPSDNGASYFGGVVTQADIQRGYINHALSLASKYTTTYAVYPMHASDGYSGSVPMGSRIQLDPSVKCQSLLNASKGEKMICQALETYGGYIRETGSAALSVYFEGEDLTDPTRQPPDGSPGNPARPGGIYSTINLQDNQNLSTIPWGQLRVLKSWNSFTAQKTLLLPITRASQTPQSRSTDLSALWLFPGATHLAFTEDENRKLLA
jgi:hypothetical protein